MIQRISCGVQLCMKLPFRYLEHLYSHEIRTRGTTDELRQLITFTIYIQPPRAAIAQSVQRLATTRRSGDRIPVGGEIIRTRPDRPLGPTQPPVQGVPALLPGVKAVGTWR